MNIPDASGLITIRRPDRKGKIIFKIKNICKRKIDLQPLGLIFLTLGLIFMPTSSAHASVNPGNFLKRTFDKIIGPKYAAMPDDSGKDKNEKKNDDANHQKEEKKLDKMPDADINLKDIEKEADFAAHVTGVRKDFLMGMLVVESDMGQKTGECTYQEVMDGAEDAHKNGRLSNKAWQTFRERKELIKEIADSLGYDYEKLRVSCNPPYAGTGGAMGIPQFMPDTWLEYKDRIAKIAGTKNPDPWNPRDGVLAMALKVSDVPGVVEHNVWAERNASKMYLSGTTSSQYDWYASEIQYWSSNYESLIS